MLAHRPHALTRHIRLIVPYLKACRDRTIIRCNPAVVPQRLPPLITSLLCSLAVPSVSRLPYLGPLPCRSRFVPSPPHYPTLPLEHVSPTPATPIPHLALHANALLASCPRRPATHSSRANALLASCPCRPATHCSRAWRSPSVPTMGLALRRADEQAQAGHKSNR